jgi:hypothetical protein
VRSVTVPVANGVVTAGSLQIGGTDGSVICTSNAKIQLTSTNAGLTNTQGASDPFVSKIHYRATAAYNGKSETIDTTTAVAGTPTAGQTTAAGAQTSMALQLGLNITATPTGKYLANGTFNDTLIVTLSPTP